MHAYSIYATHTLSTTYGADNRVESTTLANGAVLGYTYDTLNRLTEAALSENETEKLSTEYSFIDLSGNRTTTLVGSLANKNAESAVLSGYTYTYDACGNILSVTENSGKVTSYTYDSLNRLTGSITTLPDGSQEKAAYTYDSGSNITLKTYSERANESSQWTVTDTVPYTYGDTAWKDLLTSYNGEAITYDQIGNPLTYRGATLTWDGRKLSSYTKGSQNISYAYDQDGLRTGKTVGSTTTTYTRVGMTLLSETTGSTTRNYLYDENGSIIGYTEGENTYYYLKNLQGDVTGITNSSGTLIVSYTYDDWGRTTSVTGSSASTVGVQNPIRYRGYYLDTDTGLYYLNSRYYDPETGRFINADEIDYLGADEGLLSYNLFAYCLNNPVNRTDEGGNLFAKRRI